MQLIDGKPLLTRDRRNKFPEGLLVPIADEESAAAIATLEGAFHCFHYIIDVAGRKSVVAAVDEGKTLWQREARG